MVLLYYTHMTAQDKSEIGELIAEKISENNRELIAQLKEIIIDVNQHTIDMLRSEIKDSAESVKSELRAEIKDSESGMQLLIQEVKRDMSLGFEGVSHQIGIMQEDIESIKKKLDIQSDQIMTHQVIKLEKSDVKAEALVG